MTRDELEVGSIREVFTTSTSFFRWPSFLLRCPESAKALEKDFGYRLHMKQGLLRRIYFPVDNQIYGHMTVLSALNDNKTVFRNMRRPQMKADSESKDKKKRRTRAAFKAVGYLD